MQLYDSKFSLHDSRISRISYSGRDLCIYFENGFFRINDTNGECEQVGGYVKINGVYEGYVYIFEYTDCLCGNVGHFVGEKLDLRDFSEKYGDCAIDVYDELRGFECVSLGGIMMSEDKCCEVRIYVHFGGELLYITENGGDLS